MCGISGILNIKSGGVNLDILKKMNNAINHRGPDGEGYWISKDGHIGFGHKRLSILDLSDKGKQPMSYANGRYQITYNGEIFNFIELREILELNSYKFQSDTDTEVILAAYDFWGKDCLKHFNGMWAFAIWDEVEQEMFLARDHFGIKPLYYSYQPGLRFVFGSETIQFKYLDRFNRSFNERNLVSCIINPYYQEGEGVTIFNDINSVLPGHFIILKHGQIRQIRWWNTLEYDIEIPINYDDQIDKFRSLFFDSTKLRLRSDVAIASALSGGVDSSSVYATLHYLNSLDDHKVKRLPDDWSKAFVASFPGTTQDETAYAKSVVAHVKGNAIYWEQQKGDLASEIINYTKKFDAVYNTPIHILSKIYELMRQHGIIVSMDGHGVDEMMFGYPGLQLDVALHQFNEKDNHYADDLIDTYANLFPVDLYNSKVEHGRNEVYGYKSNDSGNNKLNKLLRYFLKPKSPQQNDWIKQGAIKNQIGFSLNRGKFATDYEFDLFKQFHYSPLPAILRNFDKASMMSGVEIRMPFMDHRLVSFIFKLPIQAKLGDGYTKRILRDSMKGILPDIIRTRKTKIGFSAPLKEWIDGPLKEFSLDITHSSSFNSSSIWNGGKIAIDLVKYYKRNKNFNHQLFWSILNAHIIDKE
jgi:asparagine synthase (glutamine-hydrolysing)